jgi:hypothetical protein
MLSWIWGKYVNREGYVLARIGKGNTLSLDCAGQVVSTKYSSILDLVE